MLTNSNKCCEYTLVDPEKWHEVKIGDKTVNVETCCKQDDTNNNNGCDCCYDKWYDDLNAKQKTLGEKNEEAEKAKDELLMSKNNRDGLKKWLDDLTQMDEYSLDICQQFELIIAQVQNICGSSGYTVEATEILLCMVRDFYIQLDKIRILYDRLQNCIKDYMDPAVMVPGTGYMKCLELYNEKLEALLKTKDDLIKQLMDIVRIANLVHEDACKDFGLSCILDQLRCRLGCNPDDPGCNKEPDKPEPAKPCMEMDNKCIIYPQLKFPISKDPYYLWVKAEYGTAITNTEAANLAYLTASKEKDAINSCINSLKEAVASTNPKDRCS